MTSVFDSERRLLPRWRFFDQVENSNENELANHRTVRKGVEPELALYDFNRKLKSWQSNSNWENALELVSSAVVHRQEAGVITAAEQLRDSKESMESATKLARIALARGRGDPVRMEVSLTANMSDITRIARLRSRVRAHPRNAIRYLDLALAYSSIGQNKPAKKAIETAVMLAPDNRYVLRCACRFFAHENEPEIALSILGRSGNTKKDPWILATEIAVNSIANKTSRHVNVARKIIDSRSFTPMHTSELTSSLATLELKAGAAKKSKKLYRGSLLDPTENSVAQAQWATTHLHNNLVTAEHLELTQAHEARALRSRADKEWIKVLESCEYWGKDEIYSQRPYTHASFVSSVAMGDAHQTEFYAREGLRSNPGDHTLQNNLAVALALQNKPGQALEELERVRTSDLSTEREIYFTATRGLIDFRFGDLDRGRENYLDSIKTAKKEKDIQSALLAGLFLCQEEIVAKTPIAGDLLTAIEKNVNQYPFPEAEAMLERLKKQRFKNRQRESISEQLRQMLLLD